MTQDLPPHAVIRPLSLKDLEASLELENIVFSNPAERCSKEGLIYRLRTCPELCAGVFIRTFRAEGEGEDQDQDREAASATATSGPGQVDGVADGQIVEDRDEDYEDIEDGDTESDEEDASIRDGRNRRADLRGGQLPPGTSTLASERLVGHILATKSTSEFVTEQSMLVPDLDEFGRIKDPKNDLRGHRENGRTICIHSVGVHPDFRSRSVATIMLKDYIQRITTQHIADRVSLICHDRLIPFYERSGFIDAGRSDLVFGGAEWYNMWTPLSDSDDNDED